MNTIGNIYKKITDKISSKLSIQLILSFLTMFILVVAIAFIILYTGIVNILKNNSEVGTIQRFKQCDFNIRRFCSDIDLLSRRLAIDANLQELTMYRTMPDSEKATISASVLREFTDLIINYKYIDSVIYYGGDGLVIKSSNDGNYILFDEDSKNDWFYNTREYMLSNKNRHKIIWFGGYTDHDFGLADAARKNKPPVHYISASRNTLQRGVNGTLVINIIESYFTSVYNDANNKDTGRMYLVDNNSIIISSKDASVLTKQSGLFARMEKKLAMGEFTMDGDYGKVQVVYYKLGNSLGTLVDETLMKEILKEITYLRNILVILFVLSLSLAFALSRFWIFKLMRPLNRLAGIIKKVGGGSLGLTLEQTSKNELGVLVGQFNQMSTSIKELFENKEQVQMEKRNMEMAALRSQINPHFIYNTLNTIKWMAVINKADNIVDSVTTLSDFLEPIFKKHDIMCTLEEELSYIWNYVKIMNYRFAEGFKLNVCVPEELMKYYIIRFILQPVVENALVHGLMDKVTGNVDIEASLKGEELLICIRDDGIGMDKEKLNQIREYVNKPSRDDNAEIGLSNVNRRIKLHYGEEFGIDISSTKYIGTKVILRMPLARKS